MPDVAPGPMGAGPMGAGEDDPLVAEFAALGAAVAEQVRGLARLEAAIGQMWGEVTRGEVAGQGGPEAFKESLAAIRQDMGAVGKRLARQEAALAAVPDAEEIGAAVQAGTAGLAQDMARTRDAVREAAQKAQGAAEEARKMARGAWEHARGLRAMALGERTRLVLTLAGGLVVAGLGLGAGWGLRGWWAPPPVGVFARYLEAGNNADWLLCDGGKRFVAANGVAACELRFWLEKAGP